LEHLANVAPQIECANARLIHRPASGWPPLMMSGVRVSVQPEFVFSILNRGIRKVGGVILNTGKNDKLSLARRTHEDNCVGDYLAVLLYTMLNAQMGHVGIPSFKNCYAVDSFRERAYLTPSSHKTLIKHLEAACKVIALQWSTIEVSLEPDEDEVGAGMPF
jgi:hypothetical protein